MLRLRSVPSVTGLVIAVVVAAAAPTMAQQGRPPAVQTQPPSVQTEASPVGLPVYSSDGEKLGEITADGAVGGRRMLRAEMGAFLGLGPTPVLIPVEMFQHKPDRVEVAMTAAEVRDTITQQKRPQ